MVGISTCAKRALVGAASWLAVSLAAGGAWAQAAMAFDIAAQPLAKALVAFNKQSGVIVMAPASLVEGKAASAVRGDMAPEAALDAILAGSGLVWERTSSGAFTIVVPRTPDDDASAVNDVPARQPEPAVLDQIIVTGTNIRGASNPASPIIQIGREFIEEAGLQTVEEIFERLPQNFGLVDRGTFRTVSGTDAGSNRGAATNINLRGLGADATLVLINGRRITPAGELGAVDISAIPVSAVERVDILTDGASATYGADAVGGVVNFILRDDFEGLDTSVRYGLPTRDGGGQEFAANAAFGTSWNGGNGFIAYEYRDRDSLSADERGFSNRDDGFFRPFEFDLIPGSEQHSAIVNGHHRFSDRAHIRGHAFFSDRDTLIFASTNDRNGQVFNDIAAQQYGASGVFSYGLTRDIDIELGAGFDQNETEQIVFIENRPGQFFGFDLKDSSWTVDLQASGRLFDIYSGPVDFAVGVQFKSLESEQIGTLSAAGGTSDRLQERDVLSAFGEIVIPLIGPDVSLPLLQRFDVSAAVRYEDFSDFGSSTNPKIGIVYSPADDITIRGTYGTSFKAPRFSQQTGVFFASLITGPDPEAVPQGSSSNFLLISGDRGPGQLSPEESESVTATVDYTPSWLQGFQLSASYFNISFDNRVGNPVRSGGVSIALTQADVLGDAILRNPSVELLNSFVDAAFSFSNRTDPLVGVEEAIALVDIRTTNLATTEVSGFDLSLRYDVETDVGDVGLFANLNYLAKFEQRNSETVEVVDRVDTLFNPVDLRFIAGISLKRRQFDASVLVNYIGPYENDATDPSTKIDGWATVDIAINLKASEIFGSNVVTNDLFLGIDVNNLFDEDPPLVEADGLVQPIGFDPVNANPLGRFLSFQLTKRW